MQQQTPPLQGRGEQSKQWSDIIEFKLSPPTFKRTMEPLEAKNWLIEMKKVFIVMRCRDDEKILYASCILQDETFN